MAEIAYVIGDPVEQSKSPEVFKKFFEISRSNSFSYSKEHVKAAELQDFCDNVRANSNCKGFNVTLPHKNMVITYLDAVDESAARIGAVNAVEKIDDKLIGHNTDYLGIYNALHNKIDIKYKAVIIGAGGAAKAAVAAVKDIGFEQICIINRTPEKAAVLAEKFEVYNAPITELEVQLWDADLIFNTTSNAFENLDLSRCKKTATVVDLTYYMNDKNIAATAKELDMPTISAKEILVRQAIPCAKMWFGINVEYSDELLKF